MSNRPSNAINTPFKLTFSYFCLGLLWILLSDSIINILYSDLSDIVYLQLFKGIFYIFVTSIILYLLVLHYQKISNTLIESLKNSEVRYKLLFDRNPSPMWVFDKKTHKFLAVNDAAIQTYGYSQEDFLSMTIFDIRPDEDKDSLLLHLEKNSNEYDVGESWRHIKKDGSNIDVEIFAQTVMFDGREARLVQAVDVTQKKKYENEILQKSFELKERNKELKCLYALSQITSRHSSNLEKDLSDIVKLIPPAFQFPEKTYAKLIVNDSVFESGPEIPGSVCLKSDILVNDNIAGDITVCCSTPDDSSPFLEEEAELVEAIAGQIGESIERRNALKKISQLNEQLEERVESRTNQLEAVNKELESFSYSVSHDLRAPIRAIDGFTKILYAEYSDILDEEAKRLLDKITGNTSRMGNLVDDLLAFSQLTKSSLKKELIDMERIINECYNEIMDIYNNRKIELSIDTLPFAECDKRMIKQVWINLLSNAVKFSSKKEKSKIQIGWEKKKGKIFYYIQDNGVGFNMEYKDKLFGIFQRLHSINEFEGTGVGLALCHKIISRHGGKLDVEAEPDKGAKFFFSLN